MLRASHPGSACLRSLLRREPSFTLCRPRPGMKSLDMHRSCCVGPPATVRKQVGLTQLGNNQQDLVEPQDWGSTFCPWGSTESQTPQVHRAPASPLPDSAEHWCCTCWWRSTREAARSLQACVTHRSTWHRCFQGTQGTSGPPGGAPDDLHVLQLPQVWTVLKLLQRIV